MENSKIPTIFEMEPDPTDLRRSEKANRKLNCLNEIRETIEKKGPFNINEAELSRKYNFDYHTVDKWVVKILQEIPQDNVNTLRIKMETGLLKALSVLESIMNDESLTPEERGKASSSFIQGSVPITRFLESWNRKHKEEQKINLTGKVELDVERILDIAKAASEDASIGG
jgi:hypothetical protein